MTNKKAYLVYLLPVVFLLASCDLFKVFSEGKGQPKVSRIEMVDLIPPVPVRSPLSGEPAQGSKPNKLKRTAKCAEFSSMAVSNQITDPWPIFVDAQVAKSGSGSSWSDALKSVGEGLRKAQWQRQQWAAGINKDRPILVVVAGGNYSFDHERAAKQASGGGAMLDGASMLAFTGLRFSNDIEVLGGYFPGDPCREIDINIQENPSSAGKRDTIIDGQDKSEHVILLMADDPDHTKNIVINNLTVRGGNANGGDADAVLDNLKKMGGALAIRGSANGITLSKIRFAASKASKSGGCLAITQKAHNIRLNNLIFDNCTATTEDGGAMYIADSANDIIIDKATATNSKAGRNGGALAITSADVVANSGLAALATDIEKRDASVKNIEIKNSDFNTNEAGFAGGGVSIININLDPADVFLTNVEPNFPPNFPPRIKFTNTKINNNKTTDPASPGGAGIALLNNVEKIEITGGEISNNESTAGQGAGCLIKNVDSGVPVKHKIRKVKISGVAIQANKLPAGVVADGVGIAVVETVAGETIKALSINGGQINNHNGLRDGAGLYVSRADGVFLKGNIQIQGNRGRSGAGAYLDIVKNLSIDGVSCTNNLADTTSGGCFYLARTHLLAHARVNYTNNSAMQDGGGIYVSGSYDNALALTDQRMPMDDISCYDNHAGQHGGCVYIQNAPGTNINGGRYLNNGKAANVGNPVVAIDRSQYGGAVYYQATGAADTLSVTGTANPNDKFSGNEAEFEGAGLYVENLLNLNLAGAKFSANQVFAANSSGGAVSGVFQNNSEVVVSLNARFNGNRAQNDGGALYLGDNLKLLHIAAAEFNNNSSTNGHGGAVYAGFNPMPLPLPLDAANQAIANTYKLWLQAQAKFTLNKAIGANKQGGGVYISRAPYRVELEATFNGNEADNGGGALAFANVQAINDLLINTNSKFSNNRTLNGSGGAVLVEARLVNSNPLSGTYSQNQAPNGQGGGIAYTYLDANPANQHLGGVFVVSDAKFDGNVATQNPAIYLADIPTNGLAFIATDFKNHKSVSIGCGGVMNITTPINSLTFDGGEISGNDTHLIAVNGHGGAFCAQQINTAITITSHTAQNNIATHGSGGFLYVADNGVRPSITIANSGFGTNKALGGDGGAIRIQNIAQLSISRSNIISNESSANGGAIAVLSASGNVEIENNDGSVAQLYRSIFRRAWGRERKPFDENNEKISKVIANQAGIDGGAFYFGTIDGNIIVNNQVWLGNKANQDGGAFYAGTANVNGGTDTKIISTILYGNNANQHGGAFYLGDLSGRNLELSQNDRIAGVASPFIQYLKDRNLRIADGDFYDAGRALRLNNLDSLNGTDIGQAKRGMFLIEGNTAGTDGGAVYVNNPGNVNITNMSFANNTATAGSGGTLYVNNLSGTANVNSSIIYGGGAQTNAGGLYAKGSGVAAKLYLGDSSIQNSVVNQADPSCAGGLFTDTLNDVLVLSSNFFGNVVNSNNINNRCAGAIKFDNFVGALRNLPAILDGGFTWAGGGALLNDNKVLGIYHADSIGTVLIPFAIWNNDIGGLLTVLPPMNGNLPAPAGNELRQVIKNY